MRGMRMAEGAGRRLAVLVLCLVVIVAGGLVAQRYTPWGHRAYNVALRIMPWANNSADYQETAQAAATGGPPFATPQANAMLRSLNIQVIQARFLPKAWADPGPSGVGSYNAVAVDVELRVTNTSHQPIHMSNAAYTEAACMPFMQLANTWTEPAVLLPISANLYTITSKVLALADQPGGNVMNSPIVNLNLGPHQTKSGWVSALYVTNCGSSPNVVVFTDSWPSQPNLGAVTISLPIQPVRPSPAGTGPSALTLVRVRNTRGMSHASPSMGRGNYRGPFVCGVLQSASLATGPPNPQFGGVAVTRTTGLNGSDIRMVNARWPWAHYEFMRWGGWAKTCGQRVRDDWGCWIYARTTQSHWTCLRRDGWHVTRHCESYRVHVKQAYTTYHMVNVWEVIEPAYTTTAYNSPLAHKIW